MDNIEKLIHYIKSTFNYKYNIDSTRLLETTTLKLLTKNKLKVFCQPISFPNFRSKQDLYNKLAMKAFNTWSEALYNKITFEQVDNVQESDIRVFFLSKTIHLLGKQYQEEIVTLIPGFYLKGKICIAIGIRDIFDNPTDIELVYHVLLHEIGHIFGLGHSLTPEDVMSGAESTYNTELTNNDLFVLRLIYTIGENKTFKDSEQYIHECIEKFTNTKFKNNSNDKITTLKKNFHNSKDILETLEDISELKKYKMLLNDIKVGFKIPDL
ncbi:matrixin family metalloprotease, partial [bacterium]|nr:matrixin family metalloprotease [bacterium]